MNIVHLKNIASDQLELRGITTVKCSGSRLSDHSTMAFLASVAWHYSLQQYRSVLFAISEYSLETPPINKLINHKTIHPYLIEIKHSFYQLTCYLNRLRDEGVEVGLVVISEFDFFFDETMIKTKTYNSRRRKELKEQSVFMYSQLKGLSDEYGCRFLLRRKPRPSCGGYSQRCDLLYNISKVCPSEREHLIAGSRKMNLFRVEGSVKGELKTSLSIRDDLNQSLFYFPPSLTSYLE